MSDERAQLEQDERARIAERDRAHRAQVILNDDLVRDALQAIRDEAWKLFTDAKPNDADALQLARLKYLVAEDFANELIRHVTTGEMAVQQLTFIQRQLKRLREIAA
jgi:hypothetical protein